MRFILMSLFCCLFVLGAAKQVHAEILISPTRVVFEGSDRFAYVTLANISKRAKTYAISLQYLKMSEETGGYQGVEEAFSAFPLAEHIVFAPKRVTLPPGGNQRVRLSLRRKADIPDGDYHVHLRFQSVPELLPEEELEGRVGAQVSISVSYTIPVIFRSGDVIEEAKIGQITFGRDDKTGASTVNVPIERGSSAYAVLGHLFVYYQGEDGREELVGEISNANVFPEISSRVISVPLRGEIGTGGTLRVVLQHNDTKSEDIYAQKLFPIQ